jgi:LysR family malonate utilization transcriptional regulator
MRNRIDEEITFRKLEVLLAYMETGNLGKAAEALDLSTVSVHRALHSLEQGMRCTLFRHEGRNLNPTDAARVLADAAREAISAMTEGIRATREAAGYSSNRLRIGSMYSLTTRAVPSVLIDLKVRRPLLEVELSLGSNAALLERLKLGELDAVLMAMPHPDPELASVPLFEDALFFAAPAGSKYAGRSEVDLQECRGERFVTLADGFATSKNFDDAFRIAGFTPEVTMRTGDIFSLMNLVSGGVGCTLLPGRVRGAFGDKVELIPLTSQYDMRQTIALSFRRARERDPNLLALLAVCRLSAPLGAVSSNL